MGGEKIKVKDLREAIQGSPPRGRGKAAVTFPLDSGLRITPAWAGKSIGPLKKVLMSEDHPRVGGEKARTLIVQNEPQGSPPRGRGKATMKRWRVAAVGITPAWAGKRPHPEGKGVKKWDHPRVGGEKTSAKRLDNCKEGSPPRGRGKGKSERALQSKGGITPAWAGKSGTNHLLTAAEKDHPRVGGEKTKKIP